MEKSSKSQKNGIFDKSEKMETQFGSYEYEKKFWKKVPKVVKNCIFDKSEKMETQFGSYEYVIMVKIPHLPVLCKNRQFQFFGKKKHLF